MNDRLRDMLAESSERYAPVLVIAAYHVQDDLRRIPLLVASLSDQYRFFLRSEGRDRWELTCYEVPVSRLAETP
jgi:hypothetical protein